MKKQFLTFLLAVMATHAWAQEAQDETQDPLKSVPAPPSIASQTRAFPHYFSLVVDWGFAFLRKSPQEMESSSWGSRFSDLYLYYNIPLGRSLFCISLGTGWGSDQYQFASCYKDSCYTLIREAGGNSTALKDARRAFPIRKLKTKRSTLDVDYWDFLLEIRFSANRAYPKEGFFVAIGGKLGLLINSYTTVWYQEHRESKKCRFWDAFHLNQIRYGTHARVGYNRWSLIYTYLFSTLFVKEQGPHKSLTMPHSIGLSIDLF